MPKTDHISIPMAEDFMDEDFELVLTPKSKAVFQLGRDKQGYSAIVELFEKTPEGKRQALIHLEPANNAKSGVAFGVSDTGRKYPIDKNGNAFSSITSAQPLGAFTGDVHKQMIGGLELGHKGGAAGLVMGFGIWKSGCGIKMLDEIPPKEGLLPNEYLLIKVNGKWSLYCTFIMKDAVTKNCDYREVEINTIPGLQEALDKLPDKKPTELSYSERLTVENILQDTDFAKTEPKEAIGVIKNRSSQNSFSIKRDDFLKSYLDLGAQNHSAHALNFPREIPFPHFEKIITNLVRQLDLPEIPDLLNSSLIPGGISGPCDHLKLEKEFLDLDEKNRMDAYILAAISNNTDSGIDNLKKALNYYSDDSFEYQLYLNLALSVDKFNATKVLLEHMKKFNPENYEKILFAALLYQIRMGAPNALDFLLSHGAKIDNNAISIAIKQSGSIEIKKGSILNILNIPMLNILLKHKVKIELEDSTKNHLMMAVIMQNDSNVLKSLIDIIDINADKSYELFLYSIEKQSFSIASALFEHLTKTKPEYCANLLSQTLNNSIESNNYNGAWFASENGAKINSEAILKAVENANVYMLQLLINYGAKLEDPNLLSKALSCGNPNMVAYLLQLGVKPNQPKEANSVSELYLAASQRNYYYLQILLGQFENPVNLEEKQNGYTALHNAVYDNDIALAQFFLQHKADPNCTGANGSSALTTAVMNNNLQLVQLLLEAGANPNILDGYGKAPLSYSSNETITEALIEACKKDHSKDEPSSEESAGAEKDRTLRPKAVTSHYVATSLKDESKPAITAVNEDIEPKRPANKT